MTTIKQIGISDAFVTNGEVTLKTSGLGSCVAVILYDKRAQVGGMAHIMLPETPQNLHLSNISNNPNKYCDTGIEHLYERMLQAGADKHRLIGALLGGAEMFPFQNSSILHIGKRNIEESLRILASYQIPVVFQETGGSKGRTVSFDAVSGELSLYTTGETPIVFTI